MATTKTLKPVTLDGWYEREDGTIGEYHSQSPGMARLGRVVARWADVPSREQDLDAAIAAGVV